MVISGNSKKNLWFLAALIQVREIISSLPTPVKGDDRSRCCIRALPDLTSYQSMIRIGMHRSDEREPHFFSVTIVYES